MTVTINTHNALQRSGEGLIENIVRFSDLLRESGIPVTLTAVMDSIAGLPLIDISSQQAFQCLLRINFINRKEDLAKFDLLFDRYWLAQDRSHLKIRAEGTREGDADADQRSALQKNKAILKNTADAAIREPKQWALRYSPSSLAEADELEQIHFDGSPDLYASILKLLQPLANRVSRRFQYTVRGKEISLRRILRKNMQFGGELILLDFRKRRLKKRRVLFFCDVSGSMDVHTLMTLQFVHALKRIDRQTEIFFFSTDLSRATRQFDQLDFRSAMSQIPGVISDWGGGTRIGHCLKRFNETFGTRQLSHKDIVMIFSDGWDRGEIDLLENQMAFLKHKAYKIMWLNPLMATRGYEPICQGMRAALPYVDYFLPMGDLHDLRLLSQRLEKIMV